MEKRYIEHLRKTVTYSLLALLCILASSTAQSQGIYKVSEGSIKFYSDAPEELIKAYAANLQGAIDFSKKAFAFKISISSFEGFNSSLQREHFNENYMESSVFPLATFAGKIIEDIPLNKNGVVTIRAKGKLNIHGVEDIRIIPVTVTIKEKSISIAADFIVLLANHQIKIPRVVSNKLSEEIHVSVTAKLKAE